MENDGQLEVGLGHVLRVGVASAAFVVGVGAVWFLFRHGQELTDYHVFRQNPANRPGLPYIWAGIAAGHSRSLIQAGLGLLIATPVARVAFSLFAFIRQRDYLYVLITAAVLGVLAFSLLVEPA